MFSDIQIATSLDILSAGYSQFHCGISSYDWQILVYTAWFSSVTPLTTLTVIRHWFRRGSRNSLVIRAIRVSLMFCTIIMLIIALLPTGNQNWLWDPYDNFTGGVPAICFSKNIRDSSDYSIRDGKPDSMIVSIIVLWVSYFTRVVKLFSWSSKWARKILRTRTTGKVPLERTNQVGEPPKMVIHYIRHFLESTHYS